LELVASAIKRRFDAIEYTEEKIHLPTSPKGVGFLPKKTFFDKERKKYQKKIW